MNLTDTILAPASAPGWSLRAFIRVSGPNAFPALRACTTGLSATPTRSIQPLRWNLAGAHLPVLALLFPAPNSYTGQDAFELQIPGNPHLVERLCADLITRSKLRAAEPGEFTARAYLNNKLTLDQAEGVAATIAAQTDDQLRAASDLLAGRTGVEYRRWADELATLLALTEAGIDFTDQDDVIAIAPADLRSRLSTLRDHLATHLGDAAASRTPTDPLPSAVLVGAPNAGKSTLFNALLGRRRAAVSDQAGTTRDVLAEPLDLSREVPGAAAINLCDLPGLDPSASGVIDTAAQHAATAAITAADVILWCDPQSLFDTNPARPQLPSTASILRVRTKADQPTPRAAPAAIQVCALDGYNLAVLRRAIADQAFAARAASLAALLPRHRRAITQTLEHLDAARTLIPTTGPAPAELVALRLRTALDHLGELIGQISPDDIIGRVFATFCVGK